MQTFHDDPIPEPEKPIDWATRTSPEGIRYTRHPNGVESFVHPDGKRIDKCPDGSYREETPHGGAFVKLNPEPGFLLRLLGKRASNQALELPERPLTPKGTSR